LRSGAIVLGLHKVLRLSFDSTLTMDAANRGKPDPAMVPPRKRAKTYRIVR
jgi:Flp pilus assembly CpaE family ATPase